MAWNEPGNDKDPWGGRRGDDGPPDLDEVVKNLQRKLGGLFGGKGKGNGADGGSHVPEVGGKGWMVIVGVIGLIWLASGFYTIVEPNRGIVLRFGAFKDITGPGLHWHIPFPVESVEKVDVGRTHAFPHKALMLTRDENIVDFELTVQYRNQDAADYKFQDKNPDKTIQDATGTAVREVIGKNNLDFILTEGRGAIATQIQNGIQDLLNLYKTGQIVTSVNIQPAKPPEQVKAAFDDAIKAREDKERKENEAEAYANEVVPKARGAAARRIADANAYRERRVAEAEGEANRFNAILTEFEKAPEVTRQRLYLETVESVFSDTGKVIIDVKSGNSLTYLPLDRIIDQSKSGKPQNETESGSLPQQTVTIPRVQRPLRDANRGRRVR